MSKKHLFYLDFVRCISFFIVFFYHFQVQGIASHISDSQILHFAPENGTLGHIGVSLFFIISGAALMYTYENQLPLKTYLKKRFFALFPMFWIAYFIIFLRFDCIGNRPFATQSPMHLFWTLIGMDGYLYDVVPTFYRIGEWFLGCIILLYMIFPLLRKIMLKIPRLFPIIILVMYVIGLHCYNMPIHLDRFFLFRTVDLMIGMYFIYYKKKVTLPVALVCLCIQVIYFFVYIPFPLLPRIQVASTALFFLFVYISDFVHLESVKRGMTFIGKYSYPAFLLHHIIIITLCNNFANRQLSGLHTLLLFVYAFLITMCLSFCLQKITQTVLSKLTCK